MKNLHIYILSFLSFVCYSGIAQEKIDENLLAELKTKQAEEQVSFIVMLNDQVGLAELKRNQENLSRQQLHEQVVTMLQNKAKSTQQDFVSYLNMQKNRGDVISYKPLWIINAVLVKAKAKTVAEISQHKDIAYVYMDYLIASIRPMEETKASIAAANGVEDGVLLINADCLWAQGITGAGRLVSHLDTGVDGNHPALTAKWRGNAAGVTPGEAWFDPNGLSPSFPVDSGSHGTHTMGTILGSVPGDIIGVAYDSEWISAGVIDIGGISNTISKALLAFQWTADPDGNPATVSDVPDVSSNSWGLVPFAHVPAPCDTTFWSVIDNVEAATVVVVFAAGNEGSQGSSSLRTPADRATTAYNSFSVGALDTSGNTIASYSSRGPSTCTTDPALAIKPEVVARGSSVRSSVPGGGYSSFNGTSMATPHIAGAVALLRQVNPNATVDQIKDALMQSAIDLGTPGPDNNYGHGLIDVCAAALLISPCPVTLSITTNVPSGTDTQEASSAIEASNTISASATAIYHAGDEVVMIPGFDALNGSVFRAYIEGCTGTFVSRNSDNTIAYIDETTIQDVSNEPIIQKMHIAPNPNQGMFSVYFDEEESGTLQILDFKGDLIKTLDFENSTKLSVDIQRNLQGMYFVKVRTKSKTFVEKIIKK
ncbi:Bacillopeptidase F [Kordia antarctica]|uniref:Bacillopeptidase F n=1 Tax=Kordia antarctica TaxID=1218801 RepID=A0A7L4ZSH5_9FLAO|nr:S8 family peptidase [Kordia antarctica]QHI39320.1 Bacillopeptidase F [Kordia antarctica]